MKEQPRWVRHCWQTQLLLLLIWTVEILLINVRRFLLFNDIQQTTLLVMQEQQHWVNHWWQTQRSLNSTWNVSKNDRNTQMTSTTHSFLFTQNPQTTVSGRCQICWKPTKHSRLLVYVCIETRWKTNGTLSHIIDCFLFVPQMTGIPGDEKATDLAEALKNNTTVVTLDLGCEIQITMTCKWCT